MAKPSPEAELERAQIRYIASFMRGEITQRDLDRKLAMIERSRQRLAKVGERLAKARAATQSWRTQQKLKAAFKASLEQPA